MRAYVHHNSVQDLRMCVKSNSLFHVAGDVETVLNRLMWKNIGMTAFCE